MPDRMSEYMSDRMPECMPDKMPGRFQARMPDICQIECQGAPGGIEPPSIRHNQVVSPKTPYSMQKVEEALLQFVVAYFRNKILCKLHKCHGGDH